MCNCILCYLGRNVYRDSHSPDVAPLKSLIAAIKAYDTRLSPYPFVARDKKDMVAYISKCERKGTVLFDDLEYFFWERHEQAKWEYPKAE